MTSAGSGKKSDNFSTAINREGFGNSTAKSEDWTNFYSIEEEVRSVESYPELIPQDATPGTSQYILKGNYILTPSKSGFMVIHAKRAHEQIVYSEMLNAFISNPIESQKLLFPIEKELSKNEISAWKDNQSMLQQLGFKGEINEGQLELSAVPSVLQDETIQTGLNHVIETIAHREIDKGDIAHELVHSIAKSASMCRMKLDSKEAIDALIERLFQCENHTFTPGNKKIIDTLNIDVIEQKFS